MKVATFNLRADVHQSARWKQVAEAEGFPSMGAWAAQNKGPALSLWDSKP